MTYHINVKLSNIEHGWKGIPGMCPIALAAKDAGLIQPIVFTHCIQFGDSTLEERFFAMLPKIATDFIENFDKGLFVRPFEFELEEIKTNTTSLFVSVIGK